MSDTMTVVVITQPTVEPVSLPEVEAQCRIDSETERGLVWGVYVPAARKHVEKLTGRALMEQTLECTLSGWPAGNAIILPRATPLISITSLKYKDSTGLIDTTWPATNYIADTDSTPGRVVLAYGGSWPSFTPYPVSPIRIRYQAGIANTSPIQAADDAIKLAILMLVASLFENRESVAVSEGTTAVAQISKLYGVDAFLAQHVVSYVF